MKNAYKLKTGRQRKGFDFLHRCTSSQFDGIASPITSVNRLSMISWHGPGFVPLDCMIIRRSLNLVVERRLDDNPLYRLSKVIDQVDVLVLSILNHEIVRVDVHVIGRRKRTCTS